MLTSITPAERAILSDVRNIIQAAIREETIEIPDDWQDWLKTMFPGPFYYPFASHHIEFWQWVESIRTGVKPSAFFAMWPRKGAKSTNAEAAVVRVGAKEVRKLSLYVRATQDKANESVQNIAALLEKPTVELYHPRLAKRRVGKYGNTQWNMSSLRCATGFSVVGLGLDTAVRGVKIEEYRPDLILLDDIDDVKDSPKTIDKKIDIITRSILPAGSEDAAILGVQNLIHYNSIFSRISRDEVDFLIDRIVSGPFPAIEGLTYERRSDKKYYITGGKALWEGQSLEIAQQQLNEWGPTSFQQEAQNDVTEQPGGMYSDFAENIGYDHCNLDEVPDLVRIVVWCDPAMTDTDSSDSQGIQVDGIDENDVIYRLWSWEKRGTPEDTIKRAILKCLEFKGDTVGIETDQGGDLWKSSYSQLWENYIRWTYEYLTDGIEESEADKLSPLDWSVIEILSDKHESDLWIFEPNKTQLDILIEGTNPRRKPKQRQPTREEFSYMVAIPAFKSAKAGSVGSKVHRGNLMLHEYEGGRFVHVRGTHEVLERALYRFPLTRPWDLHDAAFWSMYDLLNNSVGLMMFSSD